eukprot:764783-Hanusia_phi.AAC.8
MESFFGWTGFWVMTPQSADFFRFLREVFHDIGEQNNPEAFKRLARAAIRQISFVPFVSGHWKEAFSGKIPFIYRQPRKLHV